MKVCGISYTFSVKFNMTLCYKRLSFSNDEEFQLIELVKHNPALWDPSNGEYGNSELRKVSWMAVANEMNKSVFECRRKWRFVRDYYIHKRRRQPDSTAQRDGKYYLLQFLNKLKVCPKKFPLQSNQHIHSKRNVTKPVDKIEIDYVDSEEDIDFDVFDDPTLEKITVERLGSDRKYEASPTDNDDHEGDDYSRHEEVDINDNHSEDFELKEDYIDELSVTDELKKDQHIEEIDGEGEIENETNSIEKEVPNDNENTTKQNESSSSLHEKAIDLFFESMAAAVKTFPPQYVAEAKCKVFMAINEIESKVYKNANKN